MAHLVLLGRGLFGRMLQAELSARGHEVTVASRRHPTRPLDASNAREVERFLSDSGAQAVVAAIGPYDGLMPGAARACQVLGKPYVDLSDDAEFSGRVLSLGAGASLLTGMSTTPAVAYALANDAARRSPDGGEVRIVLLVGGGNPQGPATLEVAKRARKRGPGIRIQVPPWRPRMAYPAVVSLELGPLLPTPRFFVAATGPMGWGWRSFYATKWAAKAGRLAAFFSRDMSGGLMAQLLHGSRVTAESAVSTNVGGKRLAVLPAIWGLEEALARRAPRRAAMPHEWITPARFLDFLVENGFQLYRDGVPASGAAAVTAKWPHSGN